MTGSSTNKAPAFYWVVSGVALVWNLLGMLAYLSQVTMDEAALAALPQAQRAVYEAFPTWAVSAFAIAVTAGVLASLALLLRKGWAEALFIVSLVAVVIQDLGSVFVADALSLGAASAVLPVLVLVVSVYLIYFSRSAKKKGWIN